MSVVALLLLLATVAVAPEAHDHVPVAEPVTVEVTDIAETTPAGADAVRRERPESPAVGPDEVGPFRLRPSPPDRPPEA